MTPISEWTLTEDGCGAFRYILGKNPNLISSRVAFIEKTARIRIRKSTSVAYGIDQDYFNWAERPFKGEDCHDQQSRDWCDNILIAFGEYSF